MIQPKLYISFTTDPFDTPNWTDISSDFISLKTKRGRQHQLMRFEAGTAIFMLNNTSGDYWEHNTGGSYYGNIKLTKRIQLRVTYNEITYNLFTGFIDEWEPDFLSRQGMIIPVMLLHCSEGQKLVARYKINDGTGYSQEASGTRIGNVLDDIGWPASDRDIDTGNHTIPASGAIEDMNGFTHIQDVATAELGNFFQDVDGKMVFEDRGHRTDSPHDTSQATFGGGVGEMRYADIGLTKNDELLYNEIRCKRDGGTEQVLTNSDSIDDHGQRTLSRLNLLLTTDAMVAQYAQYLITRYAVAATRAKWITILPQADPANLWPKVLGYDISTRITVKYSPGSINHEYFIEGVQHSWDYRKGRWETKWQLSDADQEYAQPDAVEEILRPNAAGDEKNITKPAGTHWTEVDEETSDGDGTIVYEDTNSDGLRDLYNLQDSAYEAGTVNWVRVYMRVRVNRDGGHIGVGDGWAKTAIKTNGVVYEGAQVTLTNDTYANFYTEYVNNPQSGSAWTFSELDSLQAGIVLSVPLWVGFPDGDSRCTQVWVVANITPGW